MTLGAGSWKRVGEIADAINYSRKKVHVCEDISEGILGGIMEAIDNVIGFHRIYRASQGIWAPP